MYNVCVIFNFFLKSHFRKTNLKKKKEKKSHFIFWSACTSAHRRVRGTSYKKTTALDYIRRYLVVHVTRTGFHYFYMTKYKT